MRPPRFANNERGPTRIYKYASGGDSFEIAYTFPGGSIRHIHGVYFDKYSDSIFCLTGDADSECQMLKSSDGLRPLRSLEAATKVGGR
ncbi:MAG: hypothetical protein ABIP78_07220 [Pyrinomonadaceae bacterium]